jgi:RNA polymerase primary sigma factor
MESYTMEGPIMRRDAAQAFLSVLRAKHADIIALRYGLNGNAPLTLKEIALRYRVTAPAIRQIEQKALKKMRARAARVLLPIAEQP